MLSQPYFEPTARFGAPNDSLHRLACNDSSVVSGRPSCDDCGHDRVTDVQLRP